MLMILFGLTACLFPGQPAQPQAVQPTPAINSEAVATAVAGTAQAAATQTASAYLFAPSEKGPAVEQLSDGTAKYTDYDGGCEITFPAGWLAVRPNSEEFDQALAKQGAVNPMLEKQMTLDQTQLKSDLDRLFLYALRPDIKKNSLFGFAKLMWFAEDTTIIDSVTMGELIKGLESRVPGFHADSAQIHEDTPVKMIEVGGRWLGNDEQGEAVAFYSVYLIFKPSSSSTSELIFTFRDEYHTQIMADIKSIMESIKVIQP
jgi:hypothetical protein